MPGELPSDLPSLLYPGEDDDDSSGDDSSVGSFEPVACPFAHSVSWGSITSKFNSDSYRIGIDNHASRSLSFNKAHFEDLILKEMGNCRALGNTSDSGRAIQGIGTLVFTIQYDIGQWHTIRIPNSLYIPLSKNVLVSPQHWVQDADDNLPMEHGTICVT